MKRLIPMVLAMFILLSIIPFSAVAEDMTLSFYMEELYVEPILSVLKDRLLVPASLSIRDIGCIGVGSGESSYYFFVIQYVAQNKMGGYSDDLLFAISTKNFGDEQEIAVSSGNSKITYGSNKMLIDLNEIKIDFLLNEAKYKNSAYWKTLPTDSMFYD